MNVTLTAVITAFVCTSAFAVAQDGSKAGRVVQPGSQKGVFSIINTQTVYPKSEIEKDIDHINEELKLKFEITDTKPGEPASLVKNASGKLGLVIAFDDTTPAILIAPEDGWGVVNLKKLDRFPSPEAKAKFFNLRCRREIVRAFFGVAGGMSSQYPENIMSATRIEDLELTTDGIPNDKIVAAQRFLKAQGYSPLRKVPYYKACQEGWAPAPTNEAQKAIWNKVHELPSDPIKIKFDPKRDK